MRIIVGMLIVLGLVGCTHEPMYRSVAKEQWQALNGEQKQLIVDESFNQSAIGRASE